MEICWAAFVLAGIEVFGNAVGVVVFVVEAVGGAWPRVVPVETKARRACKLSSGELMIVGRGDADDGA